MFPGLPVYPGCLMNDNWKLVMYSAPMQMSWILQINTVFNWPDSLLHHLFSSPLIRYFIMVKIDNDNLNSEIELHALVWFTHFRVCFDLSNGNGPSLSSLIFLSLHEMNFLSISISTSISLASSFFYSPLGRGFWHFHFVLLWHLSKN